LQKKRIKLYKKIWKIANKVFESKMMKKIAKKVGAKLFLGRKIGSKSYTRRRKLKKKGKALYHLGDLKPSLTQFSLSSDPPFVKSVPSLVLAIVSFILSL